MPLQSITVLIFYADCYTPYPYHKSISPCVQVSSVPLAMLTIITPYSALWQRIGLPGCQRVQNRVLAQTLRLPLTEPFFMIREKRDLVMLFQYFANNVRGIVQTPLRATVQRGSCRRAARLGISWTHEKKVGELDCLSGVI